MDMIKGLMFDLDGTLLDRTSSLQEFINTQYERHTDLLQKVTSQNYLEDFLEYDQNGYLHKKHVYRKLVEKYKLDHHWHEILLDDYYMQFHCHCVPMDGIDILISYLKRSSLMIGLMTNGETIFQTKTIEELSLEDVFHCALFLKKKESRNRLQNFSIEDCNSWIFNQLKRFLSVIIPTMMFKQQKNWGCTRSGSRTLITKSRRKRIL